MERHITCERYKTDRWFSRIVGGSYVKRHLQYIVLIHDGFELTDMKVT